MKIFKTIIWILCLVITSNWIFITVTFTVDWISKDKTPEEICGYASTINIYKYFWVVAQTITLCLRNLMIIRCYALILFEWTLIIIIINREKNKTLGELLYLFQVAEDGDESKEQFTRAERRVTLPQLNVKITKCSN